MARAGTGTTRALVDNQLRIPPPPRTPSFGPNKNADSGTRRIQSPPARDGEFPAEEPTSFDARRTPVVAAAWPDDGRATAFPPDEPVTTKREGGLAVLEEGAGAANEATSESAATSESELQRAVEFAQGDLAARHTAETITNETATAPASQDAPSISFAPAGEDDFFETAPVYSVEPPALLSTPPRAKPSVRRGLFSKALFLAMAAGIGVLAYYEFVMGLQR